MSTKTQNFVLKTLYNTSLVLIVSILTKVVNLVCNIFLARMISKEAYGITKVYLEFAFLLLLYFPRETIRKTAQKFCPHHENEELENSNFKQAVQLNWFLNFIFIILSYPVFLGFIFFSGDSLKEVKIHLLIYIISANIELVVEPIVVYLNVKIENSNKLLAITVGNYSRVLSSVLFAYLFGFDLWAFTFSRVISSSLYVISLLYLGIFKFKLSKETLMPNFNKIYKIGKELIFNKNDKIESYLNPNLKEIFNSFVKTNLLKMVLTYTEKVMLSFYLDLSESDKGEYSFVVDNFAIIIRYFLEPVEESFYNLVNKVKNKLSDSFKQNEDNKVHDNKESFHILKVALRFMFIFGMLLVSYIFIVGKETISLVFTDKWSTSSTIQILQIYSIYVAIISINGIIEAYSNAIYSSERMKTYNSFMIVNSLILIYLSITFSKYDIKGLIVANAMMMIIRILSNTYLILSQVYGKKINLLEFISFFTSSFVKIQSVFITIIHLFIFTYLRSFNTINSKVFLTVFTAAIVFVSNSLFIGLTERKYFRDLIKSQQNK